MSSTDSSPSTTSSISASTSPAGPEPPRTGSTTGAADPTSTASDQDAPRPAGSQDTVPGTTGTVWNASTAAPGSSGSADQPPRSLRGSTLLWGAVLLLVGGLLVATGLGVNLEPATTAIVCLGGIGIMLVVLALVPRRTGQG